MAKTGSVSVLSGRRGSVPTLFRAAATRLSVGSRGPPPRSDRGPGRCEPPTNFGARSALRGDARLCGGRSGFRTMSSQGDAGSASHDLLVVGPGVLGRLIAARWREEHPGSRIVGETASDLNHGDLKSLGCFDEVRTRDEAGGEPGGAYPYVVFSAPPSGSENYEAEVERAAEKWDGTGSLLFTGSAAVYDLDEGNCTETTKVKAIGDSERTDKLLSCENVVLKRGGNVVRLVGLYHSRRGAHMYFLKIHTVPRWGQACINLIHYEDAASLCYNAMTMAGSGGEPLRGRVFLGCDNNPISFQKMMDATLLSGEYTGHVTFTGEAQGSVGKLTTNDQTREDLGWEPTFESFEAFMKAGAKDTFCSTEQGE